MRIVVSRQSRTWHLRRSPGLYLRHVGALALAAFGLALQSGGALAQDKTDLVGSFNDWDAFTLRQENGNRVCYMVSVPKSWKASREDARRGDIYITVTHRPAAEVRDQVNVVVGYPLRQNSEVTATVDNQTSFELFTQGDGAWLYTAEQDRKMVQAMRRGISLVVEGTSTRGTDTTDRYSLMGFTAAYNAISKACGM